MRIQSREEQGTHGYLMVVVDDDDECCVVSCCSLLKNIVVMFLYCFVFLLYEIETQVPFVLVSYKNWASQKIL